MEYLSSVMAWMLGVVGDGSNNAKQNLILIVTACVAFLTLLYSISASKKARSLQFNEKLVADKQLDDAFAYVRKLALMERADRTSEFKKLESAADDSNRTHLLHFLNTYETLALGIKKGTYNEPLLREVQRGLVLNSFETVTPYIKYLQQQNPKRYIEFVYLVKRWRKSGSINRRISGVGRSKIGAYLLGIIFVLSFLVQPISHILSTL